MKQALIFIWMLCIGANGFAQDPGLGININLFKGGNQVTGADWKDYQFVLSSPERYMGPCDNCFDIPYNDSSMIRFGEESMYCGEVFIVSIMHEEDTMTIKIKMEVTGKWECLDFCFFNLDVVFQPGYFEVNQFDRKHYAQYHLPAGFEWVHVPIDKGKYNE